jgi:hypothetical protein
MAQLYANENFPLPVVEELRRLGHDVLTTYESARAGSAIPDDEVLAFSVAEKRVLLTINRKHFFDCITGRLTTAVSLSVHSTSTLPH